MLEYLALPLCSCSISSSRRDAQGLGGAVEVETVAGLVLHLGQENRLALQGRCPRDPVALRQLADDLRMRVLRDLADQCLAVGLRHPLLGLDLDVGVDPVLECLLLRRHRIARLDLIEAGLHHLSVHFESPPQAFGRLSTMRLALPSDRAMLPGASTTTRVVTPTCALIWCCSSRATQSRSGGASPARPAAAPPHAPRAGRDGPLG